MLELNLEKKIGLLWVRNWMILKWALLCHNEQISGNSPNKSLPKWGVYRCPSMSEVKQSETMAQG